jgi:hypothetical protein
VRKLVAVTLLLVLILVSYQFIRNWFFSAQSNALFPNILNSGSPTPISTLVINVDVNEVPKELTVEGEYICLPNGPQNQECAKGLKLQDGTYIVTDLTGLGDNNFQEGMNVRITGLYVPAEQLNTDIWQKYNIKGIIKGSKAEKIETN